MVAAVLTAGSLAIVQCGAPRTTDGKVSNCARVEGANTPQRNASVTSAPSTPYRFVITSILRITGSVLLRFRVGLAQQDEPDALRVRVVAGRVDHAAMRTGDRLTGHHL